MLCVAGCEAGMGRELIFSKKPFLFVDLLRTFEIIDLLVNSIQNRPNDSSRSLPVWKMGARI